MLRCLYVQALQPYLRHLQSWAFTTNVSSTRSTTQLSIESLRALGAWAWRRPIHLCRSACRVLAALLH